jgi:hypothetical protein
MQTLQERRKSAYWAAFWGGMAAPALLYATEPPRFTRIEITQSTKHSNRDAMRGDWIAIGNDFKHVISRETPANNKA